MKIINLKFSIILTKRGRETNKAIHDNIGIT